MKLSLEDGKWNMKTLGANSVYLEFEKRVEPFHNVHQIATMYTLNIL